MSAKELNIGDYVRTKDGIIWKPNKIEEIEGKWFFDDYYWYDKDYIKSSSNIIDLIEVGDYVNGYQVKDIDYAFDDVVMNNKNARYVPYIDCNKNNYIDDIKSIVTHEMFESMEYKIGE